MKLKNILFILLLIFPWLCFSQTFMPAFNPAGGWLKGMVVKVNGDTIHGTFTLIYHAENIKSVTIKDDQDVKQKFTEEDIRNVLIEFKDSDKLNSALSANSIKELSQTNFNQVFNAEYYLWERAITPKKGKLEILQLVNPGFDKKMKVYRNPRSGETGGIGIAGIQLTGGIEKSYFIVKAGEEVAVEVSKGDYKKQYFQIFKGCPAHEKALEGKKPDWDDLPLHVFTYDQLCN